MSVKAHAKPSFYFHLSIHPATASQEGERNGRCAGADCVERSVSLLHLPVDQRAGRGEHGDVVETFQLIERDLLPHCFQ